MKRGHATCSVLVTALILLLGLSVAQESGAEALGKYVRVSPDLDIYYEEAGTGEPIIFIPGWTASSYYFQQQVSHFSENYHAISYDPRSQGRSSKTFENNNYTQHGADLKAFMDALELKNAVLVGHSAGCKDAYAYFRAYGTENVRAFVCIDNSPKYIIEKEGDWGGGSALADLVGFYNAVAYDRLNFTRGFVPALFASPPSEAEQNKLVDMVMSTPTSVALLLDYDGTVADYSPEARLIDGEIPVLNVLADQEGWTEVGQAWLTNNAPNTKVVVLEGSAHNLHVEFPDRFNAEVDAFLQGSD